MSDWLPSRALTTMPRPVPLQAVQVTRNETVRFGYCIGTLNFLIAEGVLSEVLRSPSIYPIPNVPTALRGYINRQGALIPVWDLADVLDCRVAGEERQPFDSIIRKVEEESVLILGREDDRVGVMIDGLPRAIRNIEKTARLPMLPARLSGHVPAAMFADGVLWLELNHLTLFEALAVSQAA